MGDITFILVAAFAFIAVAGVGFAFAGRRRQDAQEPHGGAVGEPVVQRGKRQTAALDRRRKNASRSRTL
jgi:hypothetical protein